MAGHIHRTWGGAAAPVTAAEIEMLPGGYDFIHLVFWPILILIAIGTNFMAILLSAGLGLLLLERFEKE